MTTLAHFRTTCRYFESMEHGICLRKMPLCRAVPAWSRIENPVVVVTVVPVFSRKMHYLECITRRFAQDGMVVECKQELH